VIRIDAASLQLTPHDPGVVIGGGVVVVVVVVVVLVVVMVVVVVVASVGLFVVATDGQPANSVVVLVLSANDLMLGTRPGGVRGLEGFGGPTGFLLLPVIEGNLSPNFNPLVVEVASVDSGNFSGASSGLNPGGKKEESNVESVSMLSNNEDISSLKSELEADLFSIFGF